MCLATFFGCSHCRIARDKLLYKPCQNMGVSVSVLMHCNTSARVLASVMNRGFAASQCAICRGTQNKAVVYTTSSMRCAMFGSPNVICSVVDEAIHYAVPDSRRVSSALAACGDG